MARYAVRSRSATSYRPAGNRSKAHVDTEADNRTMVRYRSLSNDRCRRCRPSVIRTASYTLSRHQICIARRMI